MGTTSLSIAGGSAATASEAEGEASDEGSTLELGAAACGDSSGGDAGATALASAAGVDGDSSDGDCSSAALGDTSLVTCVLSSS